MPDEPFAHALASLDRGERPVLIAVVAHSGSVPGHAGVHMVVTPGECAGTIGGGLAEQRMIEAARVGLSEARLDEYRHEGESICSGSQEFASLPLGPEDRSTVEAVAAEVAGGGYGAVTVRPDGLDFAPKQVAPAELDRDEHGWRARFPVGVVDTLTIVGGGHVSLALSRVMATLPFRIVVADDRPDLPTMSANHDAHELRVIDYARVAEHVAGGEHGWAVVMTHRHTADADVVRALADLELRYLGMLGSEKKVRTTFARLEAEGVPRARLERIHAPVGVSIGSHTPAEIAVSIAAEIIAERNRGA